MNKDELKAKYGRIANDPSQLEIFKDDVIDGSVSCLPELPEDASEKDYVLALQDGEMVWAEGGITPASEPVEKGDNIVLNGIQFKVLETNEDNTDVKLMTLIDAHPTHKYYAEGSATYTTGTDYDGNECSAVSYAGSEIDEAIQDFVEGLPQELQDAMIDEELFEELWYFIENGAPNESWQIDGANGIYRLKKAWSVDAGVTRKMRMVSLDDVIDYVNPSSNYISRANVISMFAGSSQMNYGMTVGTCNSYDKPALSSCTALVAFRYDYAILGTDSSETYYYQQNRTMHAVCRLDLTKFIYMKSITPF